jgi:hypothetical protein
LNATGRAVGGLVVALLGVGAFASVDARATGVSCGTRPSGQAATRPAGGPSPAVAWRARAFVQTATRRSPNGALAGTILDGRWLLVLAVADDGDGQCWVRLLLPGRPNESSAWASADRLELRPTPWRLVVSRARRTVAAYRDGVRVREWPAVVGRPSTPTPHGLFAVLDVEATAPSSFYGSWTLRLTAHSDVLSRFDGGDGRVAIHGRGGTSLDDPLGTARSHGCIRLDNTAMDWLVHTIGASRLPGLPILVVK